MKEGERLTSPVSAAEEPIVFVIDDDPLILGGLSSLFRSIGLRVALAQDSFNRGKAH